MVELKREDAEKVRAELDSGKTSTFYPPPKPRVCSGIRKAKHNGELYENREVFSTA
jgi:hypothetical protein